MQIVYLLTGDIGGTNSRMSLYLLGDEKPLVVKTYRNSKDIPEDKLDVDSVFLDYVVKPFMDYCFNEQTEVKLSKDDITIVSCIASAGVVANNQVKLTNLRNMLICGNMIQEDTSTPIMNSIVRCVIINDFVAQGYGCLTLKPGDCKHLYGPKNEEIFGDDDSNNLGPKVCVGAGTGLGECFLTQSVHVEDPNAPNPYSCFPSEGGHVEFAPRNSLEVELFQFLSEKFSSFHRISVERVVSGKGLANVYEFLAHKYPERIDAKLHEEFLHAGDEQGRVVAVHAKDEKPDCLCRQAIEIMMSAYGCELGSASIKWIPTGGLFVSGGLTPKNIHFIEGLDSEFMISYLNKGRVSPVLERVPLYAVMTEDLGVRGAHKAALMAYEAWSRNPHPTKPKRAAKKSDAFLQVGTIASIAAAAAVGSAIATAVMSSIIGRKK